MNQDTAEVLEVLQCIVKYNCQFDGNLLWPEYDEEKQAIDILVKYGYAVKVSHEPLRYKLIKGDL